MHNKVLIDFAVSSAITVQWQNMWSQTVAVHGTEITERVALVF